MGWDWTGYGVAWVGFRAPVSGFNWNPDTELPKKFAVYTNRPSAGSTAIDTGSESVALIWDPVTLTTVVGTPVARSMEYADTLESSKLDT